MSTTSPDNFPSTEDLEAEEERRSQFVARELDKALGLRDQLLVELAKMGGSDSYLASVSLDWISRRVNIAERMPFLRKAFEELRFEEMSQRKINWTRESVLARYLIEHDHHKFPAILAVLSEPWVEEPDSPKWDSEGRAKKTSANFRKLDSKGHIGLLDISPKVQLYALDGQHRVIGIMAALDFVTRGRLDVRDKDGQVKPGETMFLDTLIVESDLDEVWLTQLPGERMGIEIVPAVLQGETREEAQRRVRTIFTHVNKHADRLTPGETAQLDENNGFAIVARRVAATNYFLRHPKNRVNVKNSTIAGRSAHVTTLQTLAEMAKGYLVGTYGSWASRRGELARRPDDPELDEAVAEFSALWDRIAQLPTFQDIAEGASVAQRRQFPHEGNEEGAGHFLLRPVGQQALALALGELRAEGADLEKVFAKLAVLDRNGVLRLDAVENPWWGVLYDFNGQRMRVKGREAAVKILRHMLDGLSSRQQDDLRRTLAEARSIGDGDVRDYRNEIVPADEISLPEQVEV